MRCDVAPASCRRFCYCAADVEIAGETPAPRKPVFGSLGRLRNSPQVMRMTNLSAARADSCIKTAAPARLPDRARKIGFGAPESPVHSVTPRRMFQAANPIVQLCTSQIPIFLKIQRSPDIAFGEEKINLIVDSVFSTRRSNDRDSDPANNK